MKRDTAIAAGLLLLLLGGRLLWMPFDGVTEWWVWDASQAVVLMVFIVLAGLQFKSLAVWAVLTLGLALNAATALAAVIWASLDVQPEGGKDSLDVALGWQVSLLFLLAFVIVAMVITKKGRQTNAAADKP